MLSEAHPRPATPGFGLGSYFGQSGGKGALMRSGVGHVGDVTHLRENWPTLDLSRTALTCVRRKLGRARSMDVFSQHVGSSQHKDGAGRAHLYSSSLGGALTQRLFGRVENKCIDPCRVLIGKIWGCFGRTLDWFEQFQDKRDPIWAGSAQSRAGFTQHRLARPDSGGARPRHLGSRPLWAAIAGSDDRLLTRSLKHSTS